MISLLTGASHAPLQLPQGLRLHQSEVFLQPLVAVQGQVPVTRLPLAILTQLVEGFVEAVIEAQIVADGVFPAVRGRLEEREVLSGRGQEGQTREVSVFGC